MDEETPVTFQQFHDMLDMLRRTVGAGAESARRIEVLEKASREMFDVIVRLQEHQERLLTAFEAHSNLQNKLNSDLTSVVQRLTAEITQMKGGGSGLIM